MYHLLIEHEGIVLHCTENFAFIKVERGYLLVQVLKFLFHLKFLPVCVCDKLNFAFYMLATTVIVPHYF